MIIYILFFIFSSILLLLIINMYHSNNLKSLKIKSALITMASMITATILSATQVNSPIDEILGIKLSWLLYSYSSIFAAAAGVTTCLLTHKKSQNKRLLFLTFFSAFLTIILLSSIYFSQLIELQTTNWSHPVTKYEVLFVILLSIYPCACGIACVLSLNKITMTQKQSINRIKLVKAAALGASLFFATQIIFIFLSKNELTSINFSTILNILVAIIFTALTLAHIPPHLAFFLTKLYKCYKLHRLYRRINSINVQINFEWWKYIHKPNDYIYWSTIYISDARQVIAHYATTHTLNKEAQMLNKALQAPNLDEKAQFDDLVELYCQISHQLGS